MGASAAAASSTPDHNYGGGQSTAPNTGDSGVLMGSPTPLGQWGEGESSPFVSPSFVGSSGGGLAPKRKMSEAMKSLQGGINIHALMGGGPPPPRPSFIGVSISSNDTGDESSKAEGREGDEGLSEKADKVAANDDDFNHVRYYSTVIFNFI